jgi:5-methyltetrahydrofolate--homocysteine methyltransferase
MRDNQKQLFINQAKSVYRKFPLDERKIVGTDITLTGNSIMNFLKDAKEIIIFATTLGFEVDRQIAAAGKISLSDALMLDMAANDASNDVCNNLQAELARKYNIGQGRFSCGYGDLPLDMQPQILKALDATKAIGIYCNEHYLLIPQKSVTAFIKII